MISPTNKASRRTKNRVKEHGPVFEHVDVRNGSWLLSAGEWFGWLPRCEFHVECVGEKFIKKVLDK